MLYIQYIVIYCFYKQNLWDDKQWGHIEFTISQMANSVDGSIRMKDLNDAFNYGVVVLKPNATIHAGRIGIHQSSPLDRNLSFLIPVCVCLCLYIKHINVCIYIYLLIYRCEREGDTYCKNLLLDLDPLLWQLWWICWCTLLMMTLSVTIPGSLAKEMKGNIRPFGSCKHRTSVDTRWYLGGQNIVKFFMLQYEFTCSIWVANSCYTGLLHVHVCCYVTCMFMLKVFFKLL